MWPSEFQRSTMLLMLEARSPYSPIWADQVRTASLRTTTSARKRSSSLPGPPAWPSHQAAVPGLRYAARPAPGNGGVASADEQPRYVGGPVQDRRLAGRAGSSKAEARLTPGFLCSAGDRALLATSSP